jgi:HPt (histidine-containing phosphotransfer) domain-containing protein
MDSDPKPELAAALELLWQRFLPETLERVASLEAAAAACSAGTGDAEQARSAQAAAHKLAGSLGSFNLARGSILARELEVLYSGDDHPGPELGPQLVSLAAELRTLVEHR